MAKLGEQLPFVSGVCYRHSDADIQEGSIPVSGNLEAAFLARGTEWPEAKFIRIRKPNMAEYDFSNEDVGWLFHEVCWIMLEYANEDYQVLNDNLDLFMIAVHDETRTKRKEHADFIIRAGNNRTWLQRCAFQATVNPIYSPVLIEIVQSALRRPINEPEPVKSAVISEAGFRISGGAIYKLHLETKQMIATYIERERDFRALILATAWVFPSPYWKKRIPEHLYEVHRGIGNRQVDWQWLGLEISRIMEDQPAEISNRTRIYRYILRLLGYFAARHEMYIVSPGSHTSSGQLSLCIRTK